MLDQAPVLDDLLLRLGRWISDYYLAPIGEVFRTMLPLSAEFKRVVGYRITETGHAALHAAGTTGSSAPREANAGRTRCRNSRARIFGGRRGCSRSGLARERDAAFGNPRLARNPERDGAKEMDRA